MADFGLFGLGVMGQVRPSLFPGRQRPLSNVARRQKPRRAATLRHSSFRPQLPPRVDTLSPR